MTSGVKLHDDCIKIYNEAQSSHKWGYIIYKLSDDLSQIVVEEKGGTNQTYDEFVEKLKKAEEKKECRYGVFDVRFIQNDVPHDKLVFFMWSPDGATIKQKMLYASSKDALRKKMDGIHAEMQCCDATELAMSGVMEKCMNKYC